MSFFKSHPRANNQLTSIKDALDSLQAFDALYAYSQGENSSLFDNPDDAAAWRKLVWDGVINSGGEQMELDFFEKVFGGKQEVIDAKKIYFRYNDDPDHNITAQENAAGTVAGGPVTFTLAKALHSGGGKYSYPAEGYQLYDFETEQTYTITGKNTSIDYAHAITAVPHKKNFTASIRKGAKIMVIPVRLVGGLSAPKNSGTLVSVGYTNHVKGFRIRTDWEMAIDLDRGYEEVLQWALMLDSNGNEVDAWEPYLKTEKRRELKLAKNLMFFLGQSVDNPALLGSNISADYSGFDGYFPSVKYAGGTTIDFYPEVGFDLQADLEPVIVRNDARKRINEYLVQHSKLFMMGLTRRFNERVKTTSGQCTFETFKRMGAGQENIKQLGVKSYEYANMSWHFKEMSALTDQRFVGNHQFAHMAMFIPGTGLRDSKNREIPAFQHFMPKGQRLTGALEEITVDERKTIREDKLSGYLAETVMATTHCPHLHMLAVPYIKI